MLICILMVLKDKLPCTENFKIYKQNYEKIIEEKTKSQTHKKKHMAIPIILTKFEPVSDWISGP